MIRALFLFLFVTAVISDEEDHTEVPGTDKLVSGQVAKVGEFPWQVSLRYMKKLNCGGALISKQHVLTAGHCVFRKSTNSFDVVAGSYSYYGYNGTIYPVMRIAIHAGYTGGLSENDIAVITLSVPILVNRLQYPIALPTQDVPINSVAVVTGWGWENTAGKRSNDLLKKLQMRITSNARCGEYLKRVVPYSQVCAYNKVGYGVCHADSGGPLVYNNMIVGVVSGGIPCALGMPDFFTRVYAYNNWIMQQMGATVG